MASRVSSSVASGFIRAATNCARSLACLQRYREAKSLLRKVLPVTRRVTRDSSDISIRMRALYAQSLYYDAAATLDDLREAVTTLEETDRIARRVYGGAHPLTKNIEETLRKARAALAARKTQSRPPSGDWLFDKGISPPPPPGSA